MVKSELALEGHSNSLKRSADFIEMVDAIISSLVDPYLDGLRCFENRRS